MPECNLTKLVTTRKEKQPAGTKSGKPTQKSGSFHQVTAITAYKSCVNEVCERPVEHENSEPVNSLSVNTGHNYG